MQARLRDPALAHHQSYLDLVAFLVTESDSECESQAYLDLVAFLVIKSQCSVHPLQGYLAHKETPTPLGPP